MSLGQALGTAVSGLRVTQAGISLIASNVANSGTPGYVRKTMLPTSLTGGEFGSGVRAGDVNREIDAFVQRQLRLENAGGSYADLRAQFYQRLQQIYGAPGSDPALETSFNNFTNALQSLGSSPDSGPARSAVLTSAQELVGQLNDMTSAVQGLRGDAELGLSDDVSSANDAIQQIARLNRAISASPANDTTRAVLLDQRDGYIDQLSKLMDIRVIPGDNDQVSVFTSSGLQLASTQAATLSFDARPSLTTGSLWNSDPTKRGVGTVTLKPAGSNGSIDLIATNAIRSGSIAGYLEMRDTTLVEAQSQLDQIAAGLARALSDHTVDGSAVTSGAQAGFDLDLAGLQAGNTIRLTYTDNTNTQHTVTLVRVNDPSVLPLSNSLSSDPNDQVLGLDFSGGLASVVAQLNTALGPAALQFSNPSGSTLRVLDDGTGNADVNGFTSTQTVTSLAGGTAELPFFVDGNAAYTGSITSSGLQSSGFAGRITLNASLLADPSKLVAYASGTPAGDSTRPNFLYDRLVNGSLGYAPQAGVGTATAPFSGSVGAYLRQVISQQGEAAASADRLKEGQDVVVKSLQQRFSEESDVSIDSEMANLLSLQNAYAANARVMSTVKELIDTLLRM
jgi:flagellar hook-associated protein 1 FlgK